MFFRTAPHAIYIKSFVLYLFTSCHMYHTSCIISSILLHLYWIISIYHITHNIFYLFQMRYINFNVLPRPRFINFIDFVSSLTHISLHFIKDCSEFHYWYFFSASFVLHVNFWHSCPAYSLTWRRNWTIITIGGQYFCRKLCTCKEFREFVPISFRELQLFLLNNETACSSDLPFESWWKVGTISLCWTRFAKLFPDNNRIAVFVKVSALGSL